jgi:PAS domain-containing protein
LRQHQFQVAGSYPGQGMHQPDFDHTGFLYDPNPPPPDLWWLYGSLAATLALGLVAGLTAIRFSRLSTTLQHTLANCNQVEAALRTSENRYRSILAASPDGIAITDLEGTILMVSPAIIAMFGYVRMGDLIDHKILEFMAPEDRERATANNSSTASPTARHASSSPRTTSPTSG